MQRELRGRGHEAVEFEPVAPVPARGRSGNLFLSAALVAGAAASALTLAGQVVGYLAGNVAAPEVGCAAAVCLAVYLGAIACSRR